MECIVLRVDMAVSQAWRKTTPEIRAHYEKRIAEMLSELSKNEMGNAVNVEKRTGGIEHFEEEKKE